MVEIQFKKTVAIGAKAATSLAWKRGSAWKVVWIIILATSITEQDASVFLRVEG
jgi:hypothetical protein